ncbi:hypothetical protein [Isoptericola haloaureus]|uniref:Uncharacterized protein n=1 Tax=Isoptericola haloaureus TaxID=1542902 RepID=A0ABU7Z7T7_9MICO
MTGTPDPQIGDRYGKWTVVGDVIRLKGRKHAQVRCECGIERNVQVGHLKAGESTQCRQCSGLWVRLPDDAVTYDAMHQRLRKELGSASEHECYDCGRPAQQWSYAYYSGDRERLELRNGCLLRYSIDPDDYYARCVACHIKYDVEITAEVGKPVLPDQVALAA